MNTSSQVYDADKVFELEYLMRKYSESSVNSPMPEDELSRMEELELELLPNLRLKKKDY